MAGKGVGSPSLPRGGKKVAARLIQLMCNIPSASLQWVGGSWGGPSCPEEVQADLRGLLLL